MPQKASLLVSKTSNNEYTKKNINPKLLLGLILCIATFLRFYNLGNESYWIDEMSTVIEGQQDITQILSSGRLDQPPAYYLPFHFWVKIWGIEEISTRSFSVLIGVSSIILLYMIGCNLFGSKVGLIATFLMAITEYQIYYSQQSRFYSYFEFTTLLSFFFFIIALEKKKFFYFLLYALANVMLMYTHTHGIFVIVAQTTYLIIYWKNYRDVLTSWLANQFIFIAMIIPYFYPLLFGAGGVENAVEKNIGGIPLPTIRDFIRSIYRFTFSARGERSWEVIGFNYALAGIFLLISTWVYNIKNNRSFPTIRNILFDLKQLLDLHKNKVILLICWLILPIVLPFILSLLLTPMYLDRYVISASPALYLILSLIIVNIHKAIPIKITLITFAIMILPSLFYYYSVDIHEQWREVASYIEENSTEKDIIIFAPNQGIGIEEKTFNWYYTGDLDQYGFKSDITDPTESSKTLDSFIKNYSRMWVIIRGNPNGSSDFYKDFFLDSNQEDFTLIKQQNFVGISVYLFENK